MVKDHGATNLHYTNMTIDIERITAWGSWQAHSIMSTFNHTIADIHECVVKQGGIFEVSNQGVGKGRENTRIGVQITSLKGGPDMCSI